MSTARIGKFELVGADGGPLFGDVRTAGDGTGRPPIVLCHGFKGSKDWGVMPVLAERIARAGMTAVSFNFSGSGVDQDGAGISEKERFSRSTFSGDMEDIGTVCSALAAGTLLEGLAGTSEYGLFGYSRGGGAAILHAAQSSDVRSLVTWAAISHTDRWNEEEMANWRSSGKRSVGDQDKPDELFFYTDMLEDIIVNRGKLDICAAAGRLAVPWLLLHGDADGFVPLSEGEELYRASQGDRVKLDVVANATHTFERREERADGGAPMDEAADRTVDWFARHMY